MGYTIIKLLHVLAVIMFLGNIFTGLFWMHIAKKTKDLKIISHTMQGVIRSDRLFTIPGVVLVTTFGIFAALHGHIPLIRTGWVFYSIILFTFSGIIFIWKVAPLQRKIYNFTHKQENNPDFDWNYFNKLYSQWDFWGLIAILAPVIALVMMILKLPQ
ncbi:MAG TPA: DUF2269 family protein [Bacteroidales bacterium]